MRNVFMLIVCLALCSCVTGRLSPGGEGVDIGFSLPASSDRVAQVEQSLQRARTEVDENIAQTRTDTATLVQGAQTNLTEALSQFDRRSQEMAANTEAQRNQLEQELQSMGLEDLIGPDLLSWLGTLLGIGGLGTIGSTLVSRKRRGVALVSGKPKVASKAPA